MILIWTYGAVLAEYEKASGSGSVTLTWSVTGILAGSSPFLFWNFFLEKVL